LLFPRLLRAYEFVQGRLVCFPSWSTFLLAQ
jgi:hypothetical protein